MGRRIFYFQFKQDFFESQEIRDITGLAEEAGDNPNDYIILYLKMISMSLAKDGYLISYNGQPLSAGLLRRVLKFETSGTVKDTIELIDRAVTKFKEIELLYHLKDGSIFIPRVKYLAMNKKEAKRHFNINPVISDGEISTSDDEVEEVRNGGFGSTTKNS